MKSLLIIILIIAIFPGCELITIGKKKQPRLEINQKSPVGTVYLFKNELDSNNYSGAVQLLVKPNGQQYLAIEKYELYDELARLGRVINKKPVTQVRTDSLNINSYRVNVELDYIRTISFTTQKINDNWYISNYKE